MTFATRLDVTPSPAGSTSGQNTNQTSKRPRPCFQHNPVQNETVKHKLKTKTKKGKKRKKERKKSNQALENFFKIKAQPQLNQNLNASLTWTVCKWTVLWSGYQGNRGRNNGLGTWDMGVTITISPHSCHFEPPPLPPPPASILISWPALTWLVQYIMIHSQRDQGKTKLNQIMSQVVWLTVHSYAKENCWRNKK